MVDFKYDVAFSFLQQDEPIATQLNDRLQDRVSTFLYSERQKEVAGTDGEETFGRAFREEARLVVVLYRAGWGETKWTRIEQSAIRARGFEHGYDFAKFIPLEQPAKLPAWLPPTQIYIGLKRFGIDGAAAVIAELRAARWLLADRTHTSARRQLAITLLQHPGRLRARGTALQSYSTGSRPMDGRNAFHCAVPQI